MKLNIAQVIGLNTDQKAAQVISSTRDGDNSFFAVLDLTCDDAFTKGRQVLSELSDFYFDFEGTPAEKLNATFEEAQKKLPVAEFSLLLSSISGKVLYLISKGEVQVYLKRSEKLSSLLSVGAPNQLISGFLQEDDRLLFSTASLITFLGEALEKSLDLPLETFEEELSDRIGGSDLENQSLATLLVEVQPQNIEVPVLGQEEIVNNEQPDISHNLRVNPAVAVKKVLNNALSFVWQQKKYLPTSGKGGLVVAVVLILIIALGVGFKVKSSKDAQEQFLFNQLLQGAKDDLNAAKGLATLNPAEAKGKLDSSKDKLNKALNLKPKDNEAQNLKKQIDQDSSSILLQTNVSGFPLFLDMDLVKKNFRASQMSLSNGKLLLLDPAVKTLVVVDLAKKSNQILAGSEQLGEASYASLNGALAFVYSQDKGILKIDITNAKVSTVAKKDTEWGEIKDIYGFGGNVYVLDAIKNQIWKYLPTSDGYSDKREYLNKDTKADLAQVLRMQIESSVYILKSEGEIIRFTRGGKDNFSYTGLPSAVKSVKSLFISSDTDNLYLLDAGNSRLLILTKTGVYKGTINGDKFGLVSDLVVDEQGKKVYLLEGSKIYSIDLK